MIISKNDERKRVTKENFAPVFGGIDTDVTWENLGWRRREGERR